MPSKRETFIRDRQHNSPSRKRTHKEQERHQQQLAATLRRLEEADKSSSKSA